MLGAALPTPLTAEMLTSTAFKSWEEKQPWSLVVEEDANPVFAFSLRYRRVGQNLNWDFDYNGGSRNLHKYLMKIVEGLPLEEQPIMPPLPPPRTRAASRARAAPRDPAAIGFN